MFKGESGASATFKEWGGMMANILLIEDSAEINNVVQAVLGRDHGVIWASTLREAETHLLGERAIDLVLLDIDLPDGNGIDFLANFAGHLEGRGIGVIFLTGTNTVNSRTRSFTLGALDYIPKPFDVLEFQVRVNSKLKGHRPPARMAVQNVIRSGPLEVDLIRQQAFHHTGDSSQQIDLTPVEFRLLLLLMQNPGEVVSRQKILETVWGQTAHVSSRSVDHHVCGLRKKIAESGTRIESVYGVGYRIESEA